MRNRVLTILKFLLFFGFGIFLLWLISRNMTAEDKQIMFDSFKRADYSWIILSVIFGLLSHLSRALRWRMLIRPLGYDPRLSVTYSAVLIGYLANMAFPRLGEVTKCGIVSRYEKVPADKVIGTMIVERSLDLIMLILVTLLALATQYNLLSEYFVQTILTPLSSKFSFGWTAILVVGATLAVIAGLFWLMWRFMRNTAFYLKLMGLLVNIKEGLLTIRKLKNFPLFIFHSIFIWVMYFAMVWICFSALPETTGLDLSAGLSILVFGSLGIIATPGGIGAYQAIVTEILERLYMIENPIAFAFSWIVWGAQTVSIIIFGTISLMILPIFKAKTVDNGSSGVRQGESVG